MCLLSSTYRRIDLELLKEVLMLPYEVFLIGGWNVLPKNIFLTIIE